MMKQSKRLLSILLAVMMLLTAFAGSGISALAKTTGWVKSGGYWYYYDKYGDKTYDSTLKIKGKVYMFDASGRMVTKKGWYKIEFVYEDDSSSTVWYYLNGDGTCKTGWMKSGGKWYCFDADYGFMYNNGSYPVNGKIYMFAKNGALVDGKTGWYSIKYTSGYEDGNDSFTIWYYLRKGGIVATGWQKISGKWYYFDTDYGFMYDDGGYAINGKAYLFNKNGAYITGKGWYKYKDTNGHTWWYYFNSKGNLVTGWKTIGGKKYYFYDFGVMATGVTVVESANSNGKVYYFNKNGVLTKFNGWKKLGGEYYYFKKDGSAATGWQKIDGKQYYFYLSGERYVGGGVEEFYDESTGSFDAYYMTRTGYAKTGWIKDGDNTYYAEKNGKLATGWKTIKGKDYYFDLYDYHMYHSGGYVIDGTWWWFDTDGHMDNN